MLLRSSTSLSITFALSASLFAASPGAIAQSGSDDDSIELLLSEASCDSSLTKWSQSSGPLALKVEQDGTNANVTLDEPGNYGFELECCSADRKQSLLNSRSKVGFGANTTGGADASNYTIVSNTRDSGDGSLREALSQSGPTWIIFSPDIHGQTINIKSNVNVPGKDITIDGRGANITIKPANGKNILMFSFRGGNTIIAGITVDGNRTGSTGLMIREGRDYWLDHLTLGNFSSDDAISIGQGSRQDTSASEITLSNLLIHDTSKGVRAGGNDKYPNFPLNRVTIHSSSLGANDRNPRMQYGSQAHVYNTYIHSFTYAGMDAGRRAKIISENNVFLDNNAHDPRNAQMGRSDSHSRNVPTGYVYSNGDLFLETANNEGKINPSNPSAFNIPYAYSLIPSELVVEYVAANAGAANSLPSGDSCTTYEKQFVISSK